MSDPNFQSMENFLYTVKQISEHPSPCISWNHPDWVKIPSVTLRHFMGSSPRHFPKTHVKVGYDTTSLSVMFRVEDQYVRAVATSRQQSICRDSCVEFFFSPGHDSGRGYFNFEINCGGTFLFHYHLVPLTLFCLLKFKFNNVRYVLAL